MVLPVGPQQTEEAPKIRVLIVDDDRDYANMLRHTLDAVQGIKVEALAHSCAEAIEAISIYHPDCVLLDLGLPETQGEETVKAVHAAHPGTPIIVLTGQSNGADLDERLVDAGAEEHLCKDDVHQGLLLRVIRQTIKRKERDEARRAMEILLAEIRTSIDRYNATANRHGSGRAPGPHVS